MELPGEEEALAAYRRAQAGPTPARRFRLFRLSLNAAIAGLAFGGVAVAAGTGMCPAPFDCTAQANGATDTGAVAAGFGALLAGIAALGTLLLD
ncbi:hypothetical protein AB0I10_26480 [Streptomyces sp. NPDC050636]|uniref:hypothetical protein n=1 Tax=Streptomyces sp. NPDC050636 TaxID=3154510 RepID=UPI0034451CCC